MPFNPFGSNQRGSYDFEDYLQQGALQMQQGDLQGALRSFDKSIQLCRAADDNPNAYINRGLVLIDMQRLDQAIRSFDAVIKEGIHPQLFTAYLYKSEALLAKKQWREAEELLDHAIPSLERQLEKPQPYREFPEVLCLMHYNRGVSRTLQAKFREAAQDYSRAIQLNGRDIDYYVSRCLALLRSGDLVSAKKDFEYIQLNAPSHPALRQIRGEFDTAAMMNMQAPFDVQNEARANNVDLGTSISKYPNSSEKNEVLRQLLEERHYDAAETLLETMSSPDAATQAVEVGKLILARSMQGGTWGMLEEWIIANKQMFKFRYELLRHVHTYLYSDGLAPQLRQTIIDNLKSELDVTISLNNNDFSRVFLDGVDLKARDVLNANFSMSSLRKANFQGCSLLGTRFIGADLQDANLTGSDCAHADFSRADLRRANFTGADLTDAVMQGALVAGATFSSSTKLPDGTFWSPATNLEQFTGLNQNSSYQR